MADAKEMARIAVEALEEKKAEDIRSRHGIDIR